MWDGWIALRDRLARRGGKTDSGVTRMIAMEDSGRRSPRGLALSRGRVLVVIRDADLRDAVSMRLVFRGAEVRPVASVSEALEVFADYAPDAVIAETDVRARSLAEVFEGRLSIPVYPVALAEVAALLGGGFVNA
jgi:hypothetical protein